MAKEEDISSMKNNFFDKNNQILIFLTLKLMIVKQMHTFKIPLFFVSTAIFRVTQPVNSEPSR